MKIFKMTLLSGVFLLLSSNLWAKPLFLISGGFASCEVSLSKDNISWGSAVYSSFLKEFKIQVKNLQASDTPYIYTCLFANGSLFNEKKTKLKITSSLYPNQERSLEMTKYRQYVEQIYKDYEQKWDLDRIVMVGHSHGSWLLMKTLLELDPSLKVEKLVTIDAISREYCGLWDYVAALFTFNLSAECRNFPHDIDDLQKESLLKRAGSWINMYQNSFKFLHSGPVEFPGVDDQHIEHVTHMSINNSQLVWDRILEGQL